MQVENESKNCKQFPHILVSSAESGRFEHGLKYFQLALPQQGGEGGETAV